MINFFNIYENKKIHSITTLFEVHVDNICNLKLDSQSQESNWQSYLEWGDYKLYPFVLTGLSVLKSNLKSKK